MPRSRARSVAFFFAVAYSAAGLVAACNPPDYNIGSGSEVGGATSAAHGGNDKGGATAANGGSTSSNNSGGTAGKNGGTSSSNDGGSSGSGGSTNSRPTTTAGGTDSSLGGSQSTSSTGGAATGGAVSSGGTSAGGAGAGGSPAGGTVNAGGSATTGGKPASGGTSTGGAAVGGTVATSSTGGAATGGGAGGAATGGKSASGGSSAGGTATGGTSTAAGGVAAGGASATGGASTGGSGTGGSTPDPDLVLWYKFDDTAGPTVLDSSGNGRHGTLATLGAGTAAYSTTHQVGNGALDLSSSSATVGAYVVVPTNLQAMGATTTVTITSWLQLKASPSAWQRIFDFGTGGGASTYIFLTPMHNLSTPNAPRFGMSTAGNTNEQGVFMTTPAAVSAGVWHHFAVVLAAGATYTATLYIDNVAVGTNTAMTLRPSTLGATPNNWLGRSQFTLDALLNGYLDDFRVYKRALTAAEIATLYAVR